MRVCTLKRSCFCYKVVFIVVGLQLLSRAFLKDHGKNYHDAGKFNLNVLWFGRRKDHFISQICHILHKYLQNLLKTHNSTGLLPPVWGQPSPICLCSVNLCLNCPVSQTKFLVKSKTHPPHRLDEAQTVPSHKESLLVIFLQSLGVLEGHADLCQVH